MVSLLEFQTRSAEETQELGEKLGRLLRPGDVVRLEGDLGVGKTTIAQGICRGLGVTQPVTSPTFTIMHHYNGRYLVNHIDAYRIENELELMELGLEEFLEGDGVSLVEWAENIISIMPSNYLQIQIKVSQINPQARVIRLTSEGASKAFDHLLKELAN